MHETKSDLFPEELTFKQKGIDKKPTCQNVYPGVTPAVRRREIEEKQAALRQKNAEKVLSQPIKLRQM